MVRGAFSEHCFEHIAPTALVGVLSEIQHALTPGAWLRIVMPDLELYARRYVESLDSGRNTLPHAHLTMAGFASPAVPLNNVIREHGHHFVYDFPLLSAMLERQGFRSITKCAFREGHDAELIRDSEWRACESLYVEACK
jgi:predicted SAM-dependent methyltransferase